MTQVGTYTFRKMESGRYVLKNKDGQVQGTYPTAKAAMEAGVALTAAAYKASQRA
jgi:hypothetical protein